jgi:hypothetical protein
MICDPVRRALRGRRQDRPRDVDLHASVPGRPSAPSKYFAKALAHITSRQDVWLATGSEIIDWCKQHYWKR